MNFRSMRYALLAAAVLLSACRIPELIANAGPDQVVSEGAGVTLKPSANILDYIVDYKWTQTAGPTVKFKVSKKGVLTFIAPQTEVQQVLTFKLVVMYERGHKSKSDTVNVTVNQIKFFGTATAAAADYDNFLTYFDQVTPENAGKWGSVEGTRDVMNWQGVDDAYNFAMNNGLPFKFHTLVWGQQQPGWMDRAVDHRAARRNHRMDGRGSGTLPGPGHDRCGQRALECTGRLSRCARRRG